MNELGELRLDLEVKFDTLKDKVGLERRNPISYETLIFFMNNIEHNVFKRTSCVKTDASIAQKS